MNNPSIVKCAFLSFVISVSSLCANEQQNAAENVIRRAYSAIAHIEEGKVFIKPEALSLVEGKIYVRDIDGADFAIPVVFSTEGRPFMQVAENVLFNSWKCECNAWNHNWDNPTRCWSCDRPR